MISLKYCSINQMLLSILGGYLIFDNFNFQPFWLSWNDPNYSTIVVLKICSYLEIWKSRKINFSDETSRQFCFPSISETLQNWSCHRHPSQPPRSWWSPPPHWGARPGCSWWSSTPPSWSDRHCPCRTPWSCERCPRQRCFLACKATFKAVILNICPTFCLLLSLCVKYPAWSSWLWTRWSRCPRSSSRPSHSSRSWPSTPPRRGGNHAFAEPAIQNFDA